MGSIFLGIILILGGFAFSALVVMACGMSSRPTTSADSAPALLGVIAMVIGVVLIILGVVS